VQNAIYFRWERLWFISCGRLPFRQEWQAGEEPERFFDLTAIRKEK
jgi:hypothetical protein